MISIIEAFGTLSEEAKATFLLERNPEVKDGLHGGESA